MWRIWETPWSLVSMLSMRRSQRLASLGVLWDSCWSLKGRWGRMFIQKGRSREFKQSSSTEQIKPPLLEKLVAPKNALIDLLGPPPALKIYVLQPTRMLPFPVKLLGQFACSVRSVVWHDDIPLVNNQLVLALFCIRRMTDILQPSKFVNQWLEGLTGRLCGYVVVCHFFGLVLWRPGINDS